MNIYIFIVSLFLILITGIYTGKGWIKFEKHTFLEINKLQRMKKFKDLLLAIRSFNLVDFLCNNNYVSINICFSFGLFVFFVIFSQAYSLNHKIYRENYILLGSFGYGLLLIATILIIYPVLPNKYKNRKLVSLTCSISLFFIAFVNSFIVMLSNLQPIQFCVFMASLLIISVLLRWAVAIFVIFFSLTGAIKFYELYAGLNFACNNAQASIIYTLIVISCILIAFVKPKQQKEMSLQFLKDYLIEQNSQMQLEILQLSQYREEFINRMDQQCINIFESTYEQIVSLEEKLTNNYNNIDLKNKYFEILKKLKISAKYLNDLIYTIKHKITIDPKVINLKDFLHELIKKFKNIYNEDLPFFVEYKVNQLDLELDKKLIENAIMICLNHGAINSNLMQANLIIERFNIQYDLDPRLKDPLKIKRDGIKISIITGLSKINSLELEALLDPKSNNIDEINFAEVAKIVIAHYGKFNIYINELGFLVYSIILPSKLQEIRPKNQMMMDQELEKLTILNNYLNLKTKNLLLNIAKQLIDLGLDLEIVAEITKIAVEDLEILEV